MILQRFFSLFYSLFLSVSAVLPTTDTGLTVFKASPLYLDGSLSDFSFNIKATKKAIANVSVYIVNDIYPNGVLIFSNSYTANKTENFQYNNCYTRPSLNRIKVETTISKKTTTITHNVDLSVGNLIQLDSQKYLFESTASSYLYNVTTGWSVLKQSFTFNNFESIYMPSYYHKIDTRDFTINYGDIFPTKLTCAAVNLVITNRNGAFDCFPHANGLAKIPLELEKAGSYYQLVPADTLYVNQTTLEMSLTKKEGFIQTKYIYFPKNEKRFENEYNCSIAIEKLGTNKNTFVTNFKYKSERNIIGDCHNSEYCVVSSE